MIQPIQGKDREILEGRPVKVKLEIVLCIANGKKVKHVTIGIFKFGPIMLGSCKIPGRLTEEQVLAEVRNQPTRMKWTEQGKELSYLVIPNKEKVA